jgi:hypothetical protein
VVATLKVDETPLCCNSKMIQFHEQIKLMQLWAQKPIAGTQGAPAVAAVPEKNSYNRNHYFCVVTPKITHKTNSQ